MAGKKTAYRCPQCGENLMQTKDKLVCINDGFSTTVQRFVPPTPMPTPEMQAVAAIPSPQETVAPPLPRPTVPKAIIEPKIDQTVVVKRRLSKVVGEKKVDEAQLQLNQAREVSRGFLAAYREELRELMPGDVGRYISYIAIAIVVLFFLILILTLHLIPGL